MKFLSLLLLTFIIRPCAAQLAQLKFRGIIYMDRSVELNFIDSSTCIRWEGSASWGGSYDTLNYKIKKDIVHFPNLKREIGFPNKYKKLLITRVNMKEFKDKQYLYSARGLRQLNADSLDEIIYLKGLKK